MYVSTTTAIVVHILCSRKQIIIIIMMTKKKKKMSIIFLFKIPFNNKFVKKYIIGTSLMLLSLSTNTTIRFSLGNNGKFNCK